MVELARGITEDLMEIGVACRFITVDADTKNNPSVVDFYLKQGFKLNEKYKRDNTSMRLDIFSDIENFDFFSQNREIANSIDLNQILYRHKILAECLKGKVPH